MGVRQGWILSTLLFLLVIDSLMSETVDTVNKGIRWNEENKLGDLDFADNIALKADSIEDLTKPKSWSSNKKLMTEQVMKSR